MESASRSRPAVAGLVAVVIGGVSAGVSLAAERGLGAALPPPPWVESAETWSQLSPQAQHFEVEEYYTADVLRGQVFINGAPGMAADGQLSAGAVGTIGTQSSTWERLGPFGGEIRGVTWDPDRPGVVYGIGTGGVAKSTDSGRTWNELAARGSCGETEVLVHPLNPDHLYVKDCFQLRQSTDAGVSWSSRNISPASNQGMGYQWGWPTVIDPQDQAVVWSQMQLYDSGGWRLGLLRTADEGATWTFAPYPSGVSNAQSVMVLPTMPQRILVAATSSSGTQREQILYSDDNGGNWGVAYETAAGQYSSLRRLVRDPLTGTVLVAGVIRDGSQSYALLRSSDSGATWQGVVVPEAYDGFTWIESLGGTAYASAGSTLWTSADDGVSWQRATALPGYANPRGGAMVPGRPEQLMMGSAEGLFLTADGGQTWESRNAGLIWWDLQQVLVDPGDHRTLYLQANGPVFSSHDAGATWTRLSVSCYTGMALGVGTPAPLLVLESGRLRVSNDGGSTWNDHDLSGLVAGASLGPVAVDPVTGHIYVRADAYYGRRSYVLESEDGGNSWSAWPLSSFAAASYPNGLVAPGNGRVYMVSPLQDSYNTAVVSIATDGSGELEAPLLTSGRFYAQKPAIAVTATGDILVGASGYQLYTDQGYRYVTMWRSRDGGQTWAPFRQTPQWGENVRSMATDPSGLALFVAGELVGPTVISSLDDGATWTTETSRPVAGTDLAFVKSSAGSLTVYAAVRGGGLLRSDRPTYGTAIDPPIGPPTPANRPPVADAGPDQSVWLGATVQLDGRGSTDPDHDPLTYHWTAPAEVALGDSTLAQPTFVANPAGVYTFRLVVSDGTRSSQADEVTVTVSPPPAPGAFTIQWNYGPPMNHIGSQGVTAVVGDQLYVFRGHGTQIPERFDPTTRTWSDLTPIPYSLIPYAGGLIGDRVYTAGGHYWFSFYDYIQAYNPTTNQWQQVGHLPETMSYHTGGVYQGQLYVVGGNDAWDNNPGARRYLSSFYRYDPVSNSCARLPDLPTPRAHLGAAWLDGIFYAVGGTDGTYAMRTVEAYDPVSNTWRSVAPMLTARTAIYNSVAAVAGHLVVVGGGDPPQSSVEVYDPTRDQWSAAAPIRTPRTGASVVMYQGSIWVCGGYGISDNINSVEIGTLAPAGTGHAPMADAGPDQFVQAGTGVQLDGSGSSDADGDSLRYLWTAPAGVVLSSNAAARPTLVGEPVAGTYAFVLVVSDGVLSSAPDTVRVFVEGVRPAEWSVTLTVTGGDDESITLSFGTAVGATDGLDAQLGEVEVPPAPPAPRFDARWALGTSYGTLIDYRSADSSIATRPWLLSIQAGDTPGPLVLAWEPADLPAQGRLVLHGAVGGIPVWVDLRQQNRLQLTAGGALELHLDYAAAVPVDVHANLRRGWNMVSLPGPISGGALAAAFPTALSLFGFDGGYEPRTALAAGQGYWVNLPAAGSVQFAGPAWPDSQLVRTLPARWSMIGVGGTRLAVESLKAAYPTVISVYRDSLGYRLATTLEPGHGYWVNVSTATALDLSGRIAAAPKARVETAEAGSGVLLWARGANGAQAIELDVPSEQILELPPLPPADRFDVRVTLSASVATLQVPAVDGVYPLRLQGGVESLAWNLPADSPWFLQVAGTSVPLVGEGERAVDERLPVRLQHVTVPPAARLCDVYPNPFNPTATIRYELSRGSQVQLRVYSTTGQLLRCLVAAFQGVGAHRALWDGRDGSGALVGNGVYLAELVVGDCRSVKRMVLLK